MSISWDMIKDFDGWLETIGENEDEPTVQIRNDAPESAKKAYKDYCEMVENARKAGRKI